MDIVADLASGSRKVYAHPDAKALTTRVAGVEPLPAEPSPDAVVIHHAGTGQVIDALGYLASILDKGIGVLLLEGEVVAFPVGPVLQALGQDGLRALSLNALPLKGEGCVVVVSRDPDLSLRSHVLGETFSTEGAEATLRRDNELVVESIVSRARISALEADLRAQATAMGEAEASLVARVHELEAQVAASQQTATGATAEVQRLERALTALERHSPGYRAMRLASRVRQDSISAGRDVVGRLGDRKKD